MPRSTAVRPLEETLARLENAFLDGAVIRGHRPALVAGLALPSGSIVAERCTVPLLCDLLAGVSGQIASRHPVATWRMDDVFITNNPFLGGIALDVIATMVPIRSRSGRMFVLGLGVRYPDIGAMASTAFCHRRETRHEGFCMSLLRMQAPGGTLPQVLMSMLRANVRTPDESARWLSSQTSSVQAIAQELSRNEALEAFALDSSSRARSDGTGGEEPRVSGARVAIDEEGGAEFGITADVQAMPSTVRIRLEVTGADRLPADYHASATATRSAVLTALGEATGQPPWTLADSVEIDARPSAILNATYPAAVANGSRTAFACYRAVAESLAQGREPSPRHSYASFTGLHQ